MSMVVIDANIGLKWVLNDEDMVDEASALRNAILSGMLTVSIPPLWIYEVCNGLLVATRRGRIPATESSDRYQELISVPMNIVTPNNEQVYKQAVQYHISGYDAAYLTLAQELGVPLWTGDRRFYNAVQGRVDFVHWIGDYR